MLPNTPTFSVILPVLSEGGHLLDVLDKVGAILESVHGAYELIVVDDGSTDNTWALLQQESKRRPVLRALRLSRNFGKEAAISAGLEVAKGRAIVVMDADLQHPPDLIPRMVQAWQQGGVDVVEAVKERRARESFASRVGSRIFYSLFNTLSGYDLSGATDFKLVDRRVVDAWQGMPERSLFFRGMIAWLGFKAVRIPFTVPPGLRKRSKWSFLRLLKLGGTAIASFTSLPLRIITFFGLGFLIFAAILGVQTLLVKITGRAVTGFATVIILLLVIGSILMIALGIIGEYIAKIYEEVKARPRYVVAERLESIPDEDSS